MTMMPDIVNRDFDDEIESITQLHPPEGDERPHILRRIGLAVWYATIAFAVVGSAAGNIFFGIG